VQRLVGARTRAEKVAVEIILTEFFVLEEDGWHNSRCDAEIARYIDGKPERDVKKANETNRLKRHREERAELFRRITEAGQHAPWNTPIKKLREMAAWLDGNTPATPAPPLPVTAPATPATVTQAPASKHQYPNCMQHDAVARVIKFAQPQVRPSGLVAWTTDDERVSERLEQDHGPEVIRDACEAISSQRDTRGRPKQPLPRRVSAYLDQRQRTLQAADRQAAIDQRLAVRPPVDEERVRDGLRMLPPTLRQHVASAAGITEDMSL
jgi:hypothetical protein